MISQLSCLFRWSVSWPRLLSSKPVGGSRRDIAVTRTRRSGGRRGGLFLAEVDGYASVLVVEDSDELEASTEGFEILAQRGDADVVGVFELRDRALGDVEPSGELGLADGLGVAKLVEADLLAGLGPVRGCT